MSFAKKIVVSIVVILIGAYCFAKPVKAKPKPVHFAKVIKPVTSEICEKRYAATPVDEKSKKQDEKECIEGKRGNCKSDTYKAIYSKSAEVQKKECNQLAANLSRDVVLACNGQPLLPCLRLANKYKKLNAQSINTCSTLECIEFIAITSMSTDKISACRGAVECLEAVNEHEDVSVDDVNNCYKNSNDFKQVLRCLNKKPYVFGLNEDKVQLCHDSLKMEVNTTCIHQEKHHPDTNAHEVEKCLKSSGSDTEKLANCFHNTTKPDRDAKPASK